MNYLEVVNNVLRRMREDEVGAVNQTTYSKMVGDYVNDSKKLIEDAWKWSALRQNYTINTIADTESYTIDDSGYDFEILQVTNRTSKISVHYQSQKWFEYITMTSTKATQSPYFYTYDGVNTAGEAKVRFYPIPNDVYEINFRTVVRPSDLTGDADKVIVPTMPLIHMSIALLSRERGETGGASAAELYTIADRYLSDAIALDANRHPEELIWNYV